MSKLVICLGLWLAGLTGALAQTADIAGRYRVEGRNPTGNEVYRGEVAVARSGDIYRILWKLGQAGALTGTGIVLDKVLSVTFQAAGGPPGVAAFRINPDGSLSGLWAVGSGPTIGTETWMPADRS